MTSVTTALKNINAILSEAEGNLARVSSKLTSEFQQYHSQTPESNPVILISRLRALEKSIPILKKDLTEITREKAEFIKWIKNDLLGMYNDVIRLDDGLFRHDDTRMPENAGQARELKTICKKWGTEHYSWLKANGLMEFGNDGEQQVEEDLVKVKASKSVLNDGNKSDLKESDKNTNDDGEYGNEKNSQRVIDETVSSIHSSSKGESRDPKSQTKNVANQHDVSTEKSVDENSSEKFVPITKASFRLLPRNLRVQSTLQDLNGVYRKLFEEILRRPPGFDTVLTDGEILQITGEESMTKADVLRGVGVLRHSPEGWRVVNHQKKKKKPTKPKSRPRARPTSRPKQ